MMNDPRAPRQAMDETAGLCARCAHVRIVPGAARSLFYLCQLSRTDSRFPRYPRLPVTACAGYQRADDADR
jgi:hypothetical protein